MSTSNILDNILNTRTKLRIIRLFVSRPQSFRTSGREIARLINASVPYTHVALKELHAQHILDREEIGRLHIYSLNHNHKIVRNILRPIFRKEMASV